MLKRIVFALLGVFALSCLTVPSAHAGAGCITKDEYYGPKQGWTRSQVETWIETTADFGIIIENATIVGYNHCGGNTAMMAGFTFRNGILFAKEWSWRELP